jgi:hypothetical protein
MTHVTRTRSENTNMRTLTSIAAAIIVVLCAGCVSAPRTATSETTSSYKRIGVVSVTAQTFSRKHVGLTVFGNELETIDSSSWDIDAKYEEQIAKQLSTLGGFEVVMVPYSRQEFLHVNDLNGPWDAPAFRTPNWGAVEKTIKDYCTKNQVGAIVATIAVEGPDFIGSSNQRIRGAGLYTRGFGDPTRAILHLIAGVALVDCQTGRPVAIRGLASTQEGFPGQILRASPIKPMPVDLSRAPLGQLTEPQLATIKQALILLPEDAWAPTLHAVFGR